MTAHLAMIVGSVRRGRKAPSPARWVYERISADPRFTVEVLDLVDWALPADLSGGATTDAFADRIAAADGFVIVTPEYNHGYPAALKNAIDTVKRPWYAKPVGFVSYGGWGGGIRAVEQLRQVVAEVHMVDVRQSVAIRDLGARSGAGAPEAGGGAPGHPDEAAESDHLDAMLDQLDWWATVLSAARRDLPYPGSRRRR
ncbi:NADPH-dependent FMN reductase [Millisia brevis]|uniref:NADPH-dependent FMN reductase n=1 Tax=Millisia brevis TaxID=264148 RepID=UPI00083608FA|nr:NAD(P)H-dependent oxidoreductase [Millisia brevis]